MADLQQIHKENYSDMPFDDFARRYHQKFYADMPYDTFAQKAGIVAAPRAAAAPSGPIEAAADIGRLMVKGAAMGKEATPEDAADRANALRQSMGRKFARGRMPEQPAAKPEDYQPFFDEQRKEMQAAKGRAQLAGDLAEVGGSILAGGPVFKAVGALGSAAQGAPVMGSILASPWTQAAGAGAIQGLSSAQGTDTDKRLAAALGAGAGIAGQAAGTALTGATAKIAGAFNRKPVIPTQEALTASAQRAYQSADDAGVIFTPQFSQRVRAEIEPQLAKMGYDPALQPKIAPVIARLEQAAQENVTLPGVEVLRKVAGNAYEPGNKSSNAMMMKIMDALDNAATAPKAGEVVMGDAQAGGKALQEARELWARQTKAKQLAEALGSADLRAASTGSGGNLDNATRQNLRRLLEKGRGWTPDEKQALETVVRGTPTQNALRLMGKLSPGGNGLMAALGLGATAYNPVMAVPIVAGMGAKAAADRMTQANAKKLADIIAVGGSRAATEAAPNALQRLAKSERERLVRALTAALAPAAVAAGPK